MSIPYPNKPWVDGQQFAYFLSDGAKVVGTYDLAKNAWTLNRYEPDDPTRPPIVQPDPPTKHPAFQPPDDELVVGDIWYDNTDPGNAVEHVWDGSSWNVVATGAFQTTATLPTAVQPFQTGEAIKLIAPYDTEEYDDLFFQSDVNQTFDTLNKKSALNMARSYDLIDFTQNTAVQGFWVHTEDEGNGDVPLEAEFFAYDEDGNNEQQFADVVQFVFNDNGLAASPGTENILQTARVGDQLLVQEVKNNHFGQYIITGIVTENSGGVIYRTFDVKVYKEGQRAFGDVEYLAHCSVRVMRPQYVVVQDDQPAVSSRGVFWYREGDDHLFISNYADGYVGSGPQWTDLTAGGASGGADVSVGENPPADPEEGALWFDTGRLELYVYYVEGEDGSWLPASPLGARVSQGEAIQQELIGRVSAGEQRQQLLIQNVSAIQEGYLPLTGGTQHKMSGILYMGGNKIAGVGDPESSTDAANRKYVDQQIAAIPDGGGGGNYLPLSGGTLAGNLEMSGGYIKCLNGQPVSWFDQNGNYVAEFKGKGDKLFQMVSSQGTTIEWTGRSNSDVSIPGVKFDPRLMQWEFTNVKTPSANTDAATKAYVDQQVVAQGLTWSPTKFKFKEDGTSQTFNNGEFYIGSSNGERTLVINRKAADGVEWSFFEAGVDWTQSMMGPVVVRKIDGTIVFQADGVSMTTYGLPDTRRHVLVRTQNSRKPIDLTNDEEYVIHIPGILPRFIQS